MRAPSMLNELRASVWNWSGTVGCTLVDRKVSDTSATVVDECMEVFNRNSSDLRCLLKATKQQISHAHQE